MTRWWRAAAAGVLGTLAAPLAAQVLPDPPTIDQLAVLEGPRFTIASRATNHRYHIFVRLPEGYDEVSSARFPIVYVLDGDSLFPALAPMQLFMHYDDGLPDAIVVGIAYGSFNSPPNRRGHDFNEGAPAFGRFLAGELIPTVEGRVRADPMKRVLVGQSRGGTYVLHDAWSQPDLFMVRIASNPTLDHPRLDAPPVAGKRRDLKLFVASGEEDRAVYRDRAVPAFESWAKRTNWPWSLRTVTVPGGTHAADITRTYRWAMKQAFAVAPKP